MARKHTRDIWKNYYSSDTVLITTKVSHHAQERARLRNISFRELEKPDSTIAKRAGDVVTTAYRGQWARSTRPEQLREETFQASPHQLRILECTIYGDENSSPNTVCLDTTYSLCDGPFVATMPVESSGKFIGKDGAHIKELQEIGKKCQVQVSLLGSHNLLVLKSEYPGAIEDYAKALAEGVEKAPFKLTQQERRKLKVMQAVPKMQFIEQHRKLRNLVYRNYHKKPMDSSTEY
eukprot:m.4196 g.4196  ORF g.4196 m.4196 type:complete len:235 (-) comp2919_c0_seq1:61-765(-)